MSYKRNEPKRDNSQIIVVIVLLSIIIALIIFWPSSPNEMMFEQVDYFKSDEIVLTIPESSDLFSELYDSSPPLVTVIGKEITTGVNIKNISIVDLSFLNSSQYAIPPPATSSGESLPYCPGLPSNLDNQTQFAIVQANFDPNETSVEAMVKNLQSDPAFEDVIVEPNLIIGSPNYPTGSTSSWDAVAVEDKHTYNDQWAFKQIERESPDVKSSGAGVRVVIFDTVPTFMKSISAAAEVDDKLPSFDVHWVEIDPLASMKLQVEIHH